MLTEGWELALLLTDPTTLRALAEMNTVKAQQAEEIHMRDTANHHATRAAKWSGIADALEMNRRNANGRNTETAARDRQQQHGGTTKGYPHAIAPPGASDDTP